MLRLTRSVTYSDTIQQFFAEKPARDALHVAARTSQAFFGAGCALSAVSVFMHFNPLLSGGFFLFHGPVILLHTLEAIACYDLAKLSANVASLFHSNILSQTAKKYLGSSRYAEMTTKAIIFFESKSQAENHTGKKTPGELASSLLQGTAALHLTKPYVEKALNKKYD